LQKQNIKCVECKIYMHLVWMYVKKKPILWVLCHSIHTVYKWKKKTTEMSTKWKKEDHKISKKEISDCKNVWKEKKVTAKMPIKEKKDWKMFKKEKKWLKDV